VCRYTRRARQLDARAGQVIHAAALCRYGLQRVGVESGAWTRPEDSSEDAGHGEGDGSGSQAAQVDGDVHELPHHLAVPALAASVPGPVRGLLRLYRCCGDLSRLIFDCGMDATFSVAMWEGMSAAQRLDTMLASVDAGSVEAVIRSRVKPLMLARYGGSEKSWDELLHRHLVR